MSNKPVSIQHILRVGKLTTALSGSLSFYLFSTFSLFLCSFTYPFSLHSFLSFFLYILITCDCIVKMLHVLIRSDKQVTICLYHKSFANITHLANYMKMLFVNSILVFNINSELHRDF
jgi:hypothetical protein